MGKSARLGVLVLLAVFCLTACIRFLAVAPEDADGDADGDGDGDGDAGGDGDADADADADADGDVATCDHAICDYWPPCGCPDGESCAYPGPGATRFCTPASAGVHGDACSPALGCSPGHLCLGLTDMGTWTCLQACRSDADCSVHGPGSSCLIGLELADGDPLHLCTLDCDPLTSDRCGPGLQCHLGRLYTEPTEGYTQCYGIGAAAALEGCEGPWQCSAGLTCVYDLDRFGQCRRLCDPAVPECPGGQVCTPFSESALGLPWYLDGIEYGFCDSL